MQYTNEDCNKLIRVYNGTLHTQYKYSESNRYFAGLILKNIKEYWMAEQTVKSAIAWYQNAGQEIPPVSTLFNYISWDIKKSEGDAITYKADSKPGAYIPGQTPTPQQPVEEVKETKMDKKTTDSVNMLGSVIANVITSLNMDAIEDGIAKNLTTMVDKYIAEKYGPITRKTTIVLGDKAKDVEGVVHKKFGEVLSYVSNDEAVYLAGPAGSGKNVLCQQIAEVLGLDFYFTNAVTQEYQLKGFTDAMGKYQETQFYKAFTNGGLFMLDEMDASIPEVLIILNAAIANKYFDFPAPIGRVYAHKNFRVISAGNTFGNGADYDYVGRSQLDAASMNRFGTIEIDYDPRIEEAMARGDKDLLGFCRAFRKSCQDAGVKTVVSYRDINRIAKLKPCMPLKDLLKSALIKGLDKQDLKTIKDNLQNFGDYTTAFNSLC